jgi:RNA polymerase sigma-70 factor (ECF subfamily)
MDKGNPNNNLIELIFSDLAGPLQRFIFHIVKNSHDAEDLAADTFVRILEFINIHHTLPDKALCFTMARNLSFDFLRRKKKIVLQSDQKELLEVEDEADVFEEVNELIEKENVIKLIHNLPELYANVFYLKYTYEMSFIEIGNVMGIRENHARVLYFRARNRLKKIIESMEGK